MKFQETYKVVDLNENEVFYCECLEELLTSIYCICYEATDAGTPEKCRVQATQMMAERLMSGNGGNLYRIETLPEEITWEDVR